MPHHLAVRGDAAYCRHDPLQVNGSRTKRAKRSAWRITVKGLTNLQTLQLEGTHITDAGLVHLKGLSKLKWLHLDDTQVPTTGVAELQQALPNCTIRK